jgi:hypothetical protein
MEFYFAKDFNGRLGLSKVDYWRCKECGCTVSKTHFAMNDTEWSALNSRYHSYHGTQVAADDRRWVERLNLQARTICELGKAGIIGRRRPWIDFGCGDGKLADLLDAAGFSTLRYEKFLPQAASGYLTEEKLRQTKFDLVISTSVFEHVRSLAALDEVVSVLSEKGVLALHTLVSNVVPADPDWFYLLPVHCTFLTNRSMQLLFKRWGFFYSLYHLESRMWFCLRKNDGKAAEQLAASWKTNRYQGQVHFKSGFVDYWK